jgi:EAL domain-containing protein (putative c-di-GMP-specific phosphodiesterase class I)
MPAQALLIRAATPPVLGGVTTPSFDEFFRRLVRRRVSAGGAYAILLVLLLSSYAASYLLGGAESFEPLWVLIPITYAAWRFGAGVTALTVLASAILVGPMLPADITNGRGQDLSEWGSRTFFLVLLGGLMTYLFGQYSRTLHLVQRERDEARSAAQTRDEAAELRHAITAGDLYLDYQPIVRAADAEIVAVEALVRWRHPLRGQISPADFIPLAEASGAIIELDAWVAGTAAREVRSWQALQAVRLGLNLSSTTLSDPAAMGVVEHALLGSGLDLRLVDIEMTETAAGDGGIATESLTRLASHGMRLALDDFGMGYAVLERLRAFPFSTVKIDRSFVSRVTGDDGPMVEAIVRMAHSMGLEVLAEGVEEFDQLETLRGLGCDLVQGFLISRPVSAEQLQDLLRTRAGLEAESVDRVHPVLEQIVRMTGLSTAYLTSIDWEMGSQEIVAVNAGERRLVSEGLRVAWSDSLCRRALEGGPNLTSDVPSVYGDSAAARELGIQSYVSVPVHRDGRVVGTLCGISKDRVELAPETVLLLAGLAESLVPRQFSRPALLVSAG